MEPGALLDVLLAAGGRSERMTHVRHLPARAGTQADWPASAASTWCSQGRSTPSAR